mmetsp:Transcript_19454/g.28778  ORF Transcript_19454/g.28778 Transcript_19454/m.28778 type:complete len:89 (+) Transcript_19454:75-341(+)
MCPEFRRLQLISTYGCCDAEGATLLVAPAAMPTFARFAVSFELLAADVDERLLFPLEEATTRLPGFDGLKVGAPSPGTLMPHCFANTS